MLMRSHAMLATLAIAAGWWQSARVPAMQQPIAQPSAVPATTDTGMTWLPTPHGPHRVGTSSFVIRRTTSAIPDQRRQMVITVWYPSGDTGAFRRAPYLREETALRAMAATGSEQATRALTLRDVETHAFLDAPVLRRTARLPVVVFSHGYLAMPSDYTALMEELASQGFAVFSIAHTGETTAVTLPPNHTELATGNDGELTDPAASVLREWFDEDAVASSVTGATTRANGERALRGYLERVPQSVTAIDRWVQDTRDLVDALTSPVPGSPTARFGAVLDLTRIAAVGHSMGGVSSVAFCARDVRCKAAVNLDGSPQYGDMLDHPSPRPTLMVYSAREGRAGMNDPIYVKGAEYWRADLAGSLHLNFGDFQFVTGDARMDASLGPIAAQRAHDVTASLLTEFLRFTLQRTTSPLLTGERMLPDLPVRRIAR
jgi:predicted dienelactone hydrolase